MIQPQQSRNLKIWQRLRQWRRDRRGGKISRRNFWIRPIAGGLTLVVGIAAYWSYQLARDLMLVNLREKALLEVRSGVDEIDSWLAILTDRTETLAQTPTIRSLDWSIIEPYLQLELIRQTDFFKLTLAYPDGSRHNTSGATPQKGYIGDRAWFQQALRGQSVVGDPIISRSTGLPQVLISTPIWSRPPRLSVDGDSDLEILGIFASSLRTDRIARIVSQLRYGENSYAFALNSEGRAIVHPDPKLMSTQEKPAPSFLDLPDLPLNAISRQMVKGEQGLELVEIDGQSQYVAYLPLRQANWSVALVVPRTHIESQLRLLDLIALAVVGLVVATIIILWRVQAFERTQIAQSEAALAQHNEQLQAALEKLKQTQTQLIQTEKMSGLGQMIAGIAHELNNPVGFISSNLTHTDEYVSALLELIEIYRCEYPHPSAKVRDMAEEIDLDFIETDLPKMLKSMQMGSDRIRNLVLSLRNFSRLDEAEMKAADLHEGIESTLLILQHRLKASGARRAIEVIKNYGQLPKVFCLASQINQVFVNLLGNAIDALEKRRTHPIVEGEDPPTIRINTAVIAHQTAEIRIADNGPGIPPEVQKNIFTPFFTTKPVGEGTGLGLSISYQIVVEKHKGELSCNSSPGGGSEFLIVIPLNVEAMARTARSAQPSPND